MEDKKGKKEQVFLSPKIAEYDRMMMKNPRSLVFINLADEYRKGKLYQEAVVTLEQGLNEYPSSVPALCLLGQIYFEMANYEKSRQFLEKVLAIKDDNITALKLISRIYIFSHWITDAKNTLSKALSCYPEDEEIIGMLREVDPEFEYGGYEDQEPGEKPESLSGNRDEYQEDTPTSIATVTLARLYIQQGFCQKGIAILAKILKKDPMDQEAISLYEEASEKIRQKNENRKELSGSQSDESRVKKENKLRSFLRNIGKKNNKE